MKTWQAPKAATYADDTLTAAEADIVQSSSGFAVALARVALTEDELKLVNGFDLVDFTSNLYSIIL